MRTTIDLPTETLAKLLKLAAERGEKGISSIVQEALEQYFQQEAERAFKVRRALETFGSLTDEEADRLEAEVSGLRESWR